jgi:hypothetical protein
MPSLRDYSATLPRQVRTIERPKGPLQTPIVGPQVDKTILDRLDRIVKLLQGMPEANVAMFRKSYLTGGRDQQAFCTTGTVPVPFAVLVPTVVVTFVVKDNFEGAITSLGFNTTPGTSIQDIQWSLRINGTLIHPGLQNAIFYSTALANNVPFDYELLQKRTIEILAFNTSAAIINVDARISGYEAYMSEWKKWGTAPQSGL